MENISNVNMPVQPEPKKGISTWLGLAIIIVVATLIGAGIWVYQYYIFQLGPAITENNQAAVLTPTPTLQDEIADWKTYKNDEYGFEIKYPSDFYTNPLDAKYDQNTTDVRLNNPFELESIKFNYKLPKINSLATLYLDAKEYKNSGFQFAYFNVGVDEDAGDVATCQTLASGSAGSGMSQKTPISINGENFYRYKLFDDAMGGQRGTGYVYFGLIGSKCFVMHGFYAYRDSRGFSDTKVNFDDSEVSIISEKLNSVATTLNFTK